MFRAIVNSISVQSLYHEKEISNLDFDMHDIVQYGYRKSRAEGKLPFESFLPIGTVTKEDLLSPESAAAYLERREKKIKEIREDLHLKLNKAKKADPVPSPGSPTDGLSKEFRLFLVKQRAKTDNHAEV